MDEASRILNVIQVKALEYSEPMPTALYVWVVCCFLIVELKEVW